MPTPKITSARLVALGRYGVETTTGARSWDIELTFGGGQREAVHDMVAKLVRQRLTEAVDAAFNDSIAQMVKDALEKGWADYSSYGEQGPVVPLAKRVDGLLKRIDGDSYSNKNRLSCLDKHVDAALSEFLSKGLSEDVKATREAFKQRVSAVLNAKLTEVLAHHLGLGPEPR